MVELGTVPCTECLILCFVLLATSLDALYPSFCVYFCDAWKIKWNNKLLDIVVRFIGEK